MRHVIALSSSHDSWIIIYQFTKGKAAAARATFALPQVTQLLFLIFQGPLDQNVARVARVRFCNKITGSMLQNIYRIELFATCCKH